MSLRDIFVALTRAGGVAGTGSRPMTAPVAPPRAVSTGAAVGICAASTWRFRVLIAAMVGLELLRAAYVEWTLHLAPLASAAPLTTASRRSGGLHARPSAIWAMAWVVTAIVVQGAHPSDDRAFWRTRPLAPHAVALAKFALFGLSFSSCRRPSTSALLAYGAPLSAHVAATIQIAVTAGAAIPELGARHRDPHAAALPRRGRRADRSA